MSQSKKKRSNGLHKKEKHTKKLTRKLREEDEEELDSYRLSLNADDFDDFLIAEALRLDDRRLRRRKNYGDYVV